MPRSPPTRPAARWCVVGKRPATRRPHGARRRAGSTPRSARVDPEDSWQQHFADTLRGGLLPRRPARGRDPGPGGAGGGRGAGRRGAARSPAPTDGRLDQRFFGAHRWRRTCYAGDYTGRAMLHTLAAKVAELGIPVDRGAVRLARCWSPTARASARWPSTCTTGSRTALRGRRGGAGGGGHTRIWRAARPRGGTRTSATAIALALRAGCRLTDMELVQFHPTGMVAPEEAAGTLVTEAVRGEGGHLYNADGERFMARYDPERMELSHPRPGRAGQLHRDRRGPRRPARRGVPRHHPPSARTLILDEAAAHVPPVHRVPDAGHLPRAHGGGAHRALLDGRGRGRPGDPRHRGGRPVRGRGGAPPGCTAPTGWAATRSAETVVFGRRAGEAAAALLGRLRRRHLPRRHRRCRRGAGQLIRPAPSSPDRCSGRCATPCGSAAASSATQRRPAGRTRRGSPSCAGGRRTSTSGPAPRADADLAQALDLRGSLAAAEATLRGALARTESRGAHQRRDLPELDPELLVNFQARLDGTGRLTVDARPVPPVPAELAGWTRPDPDLNLAGRLLE